MNEDDLRDCFAMFAMMGLLINDRGLSAGERVAESSYKMADAMLEARSQSDEEGIAVIKKRKYVRKN